MLQENAWLRPSHAIAPANMQPLRRESLNDSNRFCRQAMKHPQAEIRTFEAEMSAIPISFGAERPVPQSASVQLSYSAPWVNVGIEVAPTAQKSGEMNECRLC